MAIDLEKAGLTKRSLFLFGVLGIVLVAYGAYSLGMLDKPPAAQPTVVKPTGGQPVPPPQQTPAATAPAADPSSANLTLRDPFQVPVGYRMPEKESIVEKPATRPENGAAGMPQLKGTMSGPGGRSAIIFFGGKSQSVRAGDRVGPYSLVSIGENYAVLEGPGGSTTLRVGRL